MVVVLTDDVCFGGLSFARLRFIASRLHTNYSRPILS